LVTWFLSTASGRYSFFDARYLILDDILTGPKIQIIEHRGSSIENQVSILDCKQPPVIGDQRPITGKQRPEISSQRPLTLSFDNELLAIAKDS
jgi:hypothetical protein